MKFRTDKDIIRFIGISLGAILIGIIFFIYIQAISIFGFILIIGGLIGLFIVLLVTFKIRQALLYIAGLIILLRMLKLSPSLTPSFELSEGARHLWLIGIFAFVILRWHYKSKGE
jgi:hypothetical protein